MHDYPRPAWRPEEAPSIEWVLACLRANLPGKHFTLFSHGSCVVWPADGSLSEQACAQRLLAAVSQPPDFKVRHDARGDFLVTFKGGIGGAVSAEFVRTHFDALSVAALTQGKLPSELLLGADPSAPADPDLVAGLFVRGRLYLDVQARQAVAIV
jgi:hypothetical protein